MAALICLIATITVGCAETVKKAAKSAAPAAVEGAVEEAKKPDTRSDIATLLADPEIRSAAGSLSSAVLAGALDGLTDDERARALRQLTDGMVRSMGASLAKSLRDDIGPQLSETLAEAVDRSLEQAVDADMAQRLEGMTRAIARGMMTGMGETLVGPSGQPTLAWGPMLGQLARQVTHEAAFGLDDAVRQAEEHAGTRPPARVLAALGTLSTLTQALPWLLAAGLLVVVLGALPVAWLVFRLRHYRRQSLAHEGAALALARAIKAAEPLAWSNELREHLARQTRNGSDADALSGWLREHAELRLAPRETAPRSERSAFMG